MDRLLILMIPVIIGFLCVGKCSQDMVAADSKEACYEQTKDVRCWELK